MAWRLPWAIPRAGCHSDLGKRVSQRCLPRPFFGGICVATSAIEAKVKSIIADQLGVGEDEIKTESSFIEDLGADSLDIVELVMAMEEEFEVEIPDEEAENIKTVGDAVNYINTHKKA